MENFKNIFQHIYFENMGLMIDSKEVNIVTYLLEQCLKKPNAIAFIVLENGEDTERKISYAELGREVKSLGAQLAEKNGYNKRALLFYQDTVEFIIAFLACQYSGMIPVPSPYGKGKNQVSRVTGIIENSEADFIFCSDSSINYLKEILDKNSENRGIEVVSTTATGEKHFGKDLSSFLPLHNDTALIQYTSGSLSKPKGVVISNDNLLYNQQLIKDTFKCDENSVILSWLPFHHDMGLIGNILHTVYIGCTCILMYPLHFVQKPIRWLKAITQYKVTHSGGPNFAFDLCVNKILPHEMSGLNLSSWKVTFNGSEPIRYDTILRFTTHFQSAGFNESFFPCYGLAEATLLVSGLRSGVKPTSLIVDKHTLARGDCRVKLKDVEDSYSERIVSSGKVAVGLEVKIFSVDGHEEYDELKEGEICISGRSVMEGYWKRDGKDVFYGSDDKLFLRTGDSGFFYKEELFVRGRLKETIIIRGENYYPYDIEYMISRDNPDIETNGVVIFNRDHSDEELVIIAELKRNLLRHVDTVKVIRLIDQQVTGFLGISAYDIILTKPLGIPRTTSGKLQRMKCKKEFYKKTLSVIGSKLKDKMVKSEASRTLLLQVMNHPDRHNVKLYLTALIESKIGFSDPEYLNDQSQLADLGIDSLRTTELVNSINRDLNISMDVSRIFQDNTLSALVDRIENLLWLKSTSFSGKEIII